MRLALQCRPGWAACPPKARLLSAGGSWPMTVEEMAWQIEFFKTLVPGR